MRQLAREADEQLVWGAGGNAPIRACVPGQQINCGCPGGSSGVQVCSPDGNSYGPCVCGDGGGGPDAGDGGEGDALGDSATDAEGEGGVCTLEGRAMAGDASPAGAVGWAERFGLTGGTLATGVAIAPSTGDLVVVGGLTGTVDFGGGVETSHGSMDMCGTPGYDTFVAAFDPSGAYEWAKNFGNGLLVGANGVAVDGSGNVAVAGIFQGSVSFGGPTLTAVGNDDVFVVKLDSAGNHLWSKSFGVVGQDQGLNNVAVDGSGNVLITGEGTSLDLGGDR